MGALLQIAVCLLLWAQAAGSLSIIVTDPYDNPVPGAKLTLLSAALGFEQAAECDASGQCYLSGLQLGQYTLTVNAPGFKPYVKPLDLNDNTTLGISIRLTVNQVNNAIQVDVPIAINDRPINLDSLDLIDSPDLIEPRSLEPFYLFPERLANPRAESGSLETVTEEALLNGERTLRESPLEGAVVTAEPRSLTETESLFVTVRDPLGRMVTGLERENFRIFEEGRECPVTEVSVPENGAIVLILNLRKSSKKTEVALASLLTHTGPSDQVHLLWSDATGDWKIQDRPRSIPGDRAVRSLQAALSTSIPLLSNSTLERRMILMLTDHETELPAESEDAVLRRLIAAQIVFSAVTLTVPGAQDGVPSLSYSSADRLCAVTGGWCADGQGVPSIDIADLLASEVLRFRNSYRVRYLTPFAGRAEVRSLRVATQNIRGLPRLTTHSRLLALPR